MLSSQTNRICSPVEEVIIGANAMPNATYARLELLFEAEYVTPRKIALAVIVQAATVA